MSSAVKRRPAGQGGRVPVTSRGASVAVLSKASGMIRVESPVQQRLRRLAVEGKIRLGTGRPLSAWSPPNLGGGLPEQLARDRSARDPGPLGTGMRRRGA